MSRKSAWAAGIFGGLLLLATIVLSLAVGVVDLTLGETLEVLFNRSSAEPTVEAVVWSIRLPRIIVAMLVGAALATVGTVMQAILRNPLAEPGITGVSAGAAVGAVAAIMLGATGSARWGIPLAAFAGAAAVSFLLLIILQTRRDLGTATIILVGVSFSALAGAIINMLIANAREDSLVRSALFWLAGDLELRTWDHVLLLIGPVVLGVTFLFTRTHALDALSLGESTAATSGINVTRERIVLLLVASLVTGAAVAVSGVISFVGLVVPHAIRIVVGASHARLLPLSAVGGALFLALADTVARGAFGSVIVQTGVVAALVGAPIFLFLLLKRQSS
ncbi:MAG: iron ABC transporter permease [Microbacteriaceae bacterium]|nr:iron ABC transporter permease [Microbacteriaceae bacterium]